MSFPIYIYIYVLQVFLYCRRFLMKMYQKMQQGESLPSFVQYLNVDLNKKSCMAEDVALKCLVMAYEHRAARYVCDVSDQSV